MPTDWLVHAQWMLWLLHMVRPTVPAVLLVVKNASYRGVWTVGICWKRLHALTLEPLPCGARSRPCHQTRGRRSCQLGWELQLLGIGEHPHNPQSDIDTADQAPASHVELALTGKMEGTTTCKSYSARGLGQKSQKE